MNTNPFRDYMNYKRSPEFAEKERLKKESDIKRRMEFAERLGLDFRNDITELCSVTILS